jgi:hypothetical protein
MFAEMFAEQRGIDSGDMNDMNGKTLPTQRGT